MASSTTKAAAERHQRILLELLKQPGNEVCADCKTRNPRWASWNLGIFICVKCAGIHRKLGTHITKVKSLTLDSWTKEQVQCMKQLGNIKSNQIYIPNGARNPPPTDLEESERDSQLEKYIRTNEFDLPSISSKPTLNVARSPCGVTAFPERRQIANPRTVTSGSAQTTAQFQPVSQDTSSIHHHNSQVPQPPLRPATAPIPSDAYSSSQCAPPVHVRSFALRHQHIPGQHVQESRRHRHRRAFWEQRQSGQHEHLPTAELHRSNQMNGLEADMGRLTYGSQMNAPPNQHQLSRNPFLQTAISPLDSNNPAWPSLTTSHRQTRQCSAITTNPILSLTNILHSPILTLSPIETRSLQTINNLSNQILTVSNLLSAFSSTIFNPIIDQSTLSIL
ncbi:hypothetical protein PSTT_12817 [Puccinia striiformis]|uniref:Arf-GAP domain-containing protein n=1 Tax=Puccinia striiformis TaxID=27350 RepID=A0A2S4UUV3_9BASI|nr:hypothetical protein PSTT_12817 [Puccinia striiformis]